MDEDYGTPIGERQVAGKSLKEYAFNQAGVAEKVLELIEIIKQPPG